MQMDRRQALAALVLPLLLARGAGACAHGPQGPATPEKATVQPPATANSGSFSFALVGDTPYSSRDEHWIAQILSSLDRKLRFVVHIGDIKASWESCEDALLTRRRDLLENASTVPLIYVPGDNEWTDCARGLGLGYKPLERLATLRRLFFQREASAASRYTVALESQDDPQGRWPENRRWHTEGTLFVTLNRPGGVDLQHIEPKLGQALAALEQANERWLTQALAQVDPGQLVVILAHADPLFEHDRPGRAADPDDAHAHFRQVLRRLCARHTGTVLLIHGDTHRFRHDQPLLDEKGGTVPNFWRVESFGWPYSAAWVSIDVHPDRAPGFSVHTHTVDPIQRP
jgi:hypothetical protein